MKLEVGKRYRVSGWGKNMYIDVLFVSKKHVFARDQDDREEVFGIDEDWIEVPDSNKWLKTGWVSVRPGNVKQMITGHHEGSISPYRVEGRWITDARMEERFEPCESPIGGGK